MNGRKWCVCISVLLLTACQGNQTKHTQSRAKDTITEKVADGDKKDVQDTMNVNQPVAVYERHLGDEPTNNDFVVKVFPTHKTNVFSTEIRYGGNKAKDEFTMLPKEYYKKIALKKGRSNNECILGFIDSSGTFKEMKSITVSGTHIGIKALKDYYLSTKQ